MLKPKPKHQITKKNIKVHEVRFQAEMADIEEKNSDNPLKWNLKTCSLSSAGYKVSNLAISEMFRVFSPYLLSILLRTQHL